MNRLRLMQKNYYVILGVRSDANADQIRSAFRRRARELHPDQSGMDSGPFLELQEAYNVLSDPERRRRYDRQSAHPQRPLNWHRPPPEPLVPLRSRPRGEPFRQPSEEIDFVIYDVGPGWIRVIWEW